MTESSRPKNDSFPSQTTTLLIGTLAPEDSQLALNFETIFPGATRIIPVFVNSGEVAQHDSEVNKKSKEKRHRHHRRQTDAKNNTSSKKVKPQAGK